MSSARLSGRSATARSAVRFSGRPGVQTKVVKTTPLKNLKQFVFFDFKDTKHIHIYIYINIIYMFVCLLFVLSSFHTYFNLV